MTIPFNNLYDYIFSLTGHNNKNLIMYRFDPHGSKDLKNLIIHNELEIIKIPMISTGRKVISFHYKLLFCYDQEPLNFNLYEGEKSQKHRKELFFNSSEGLSHFDNDIGKKLLEKENIAGHPEVLPTIYDKKLLLHSEKNSKDLKKYENNGFLGIYYWSHAFIALDWYRFAEYDKSLVYPKYFKKDFNIYCRAWTGSREYRLKFLSMIKKEKISNQCNIFFNEYDAGYNFYDHKFKNNIWQINDKEIQNIKDLNYNKNKDDNSSLSAAYTVKDYKESAIDIVLETVFDQKKVHLTEKILRPISCGKPFILVSEKGSLEYLRSYGFKTFGHLIDERYDYIDSPEERLKFVMNTMKKNHSAMFI